MRNIFHISGQQWIWGCCSILLLCTSLFINHFHPTITEKIYSEGGRDQLVQIAGTPKERFNEPNYYIGEMETLVFGPLSVALAGFGFLIFGLTFLKEASTKVFGCAVFLFLLATKFEVLFFPPYGDAIGGPLAEAIWLLTNSFNYVELWNQPGYVLGGPKVYLFSIYPTLMALLIKFLPSAKVFIVVSHLLTFALVAIIAALYRRMLLRVLDSWLAMAGTVMFLSVPIALSMFEAINMEVLVLFLGILSVAFLVDKRIILASVFAVLTAYTKGYGILICAAVVTCSILWFFGAKSVGERLKYLCSALVVGVLALYQVFLAMSLTFQFMPEGYTKILSGWDSLKTAWIFYFFIVFLLIYLKKLVYDFKIWKTDRESFTSEIQKHNRTVFVMFVVMFFWFVFFLNHMTVSPRYSFILIPFIIFCGIYSTLYLLKNKMVTQVVLVGAIAISLINSYGIFYPPIQGYNYVLQERSLEYRNDLRLNLRVAEMAMREFKKFKFGSPFLIGQILAFPQLGYVPDRLDVMMYGWPIQYGEIEQFRGLRFVDISRTIWIGVKSGLPKEVPYPYGEGDVVIRRVNAGRHNAVFFIGGYAIERVRVIMDSYKQMSDIRKATE